ncbi:putative E3 ubiquitin-protein ligase RING1a [Coffea eugenioides]|uniref:putative E3 ubiquitin-protein ligase RING1a n=1 Tax=Coffea eugenioides TaxID=49369 RepID=UPI000F60EE11|nr:putative E3 ubiquitin-protein ligase RING1a [Coffea eugenioides]
MAAQKRTSIPQGGEEHSAPHSSRPRRKQSRRIGGDQAAKMAADQEPQLRQLQQQPVQEAEDQPPPQAPDDQEPVQPNPDEDSGGSGTDPEEFDEIIDVVRGALRTNVQCPICLGIIKKTRTVMGCLHRFCQECIDKSMRIGNNECPACRIHCSSRRSLRDDLDYDTLIEAIYPDLAEYELEENVFHEEEKARNKQVQASIAEISRRQSEALNKRRRTYRDADDLRVPRSRSATSRRRSNQRTDIEPDNVSERENDLQGNLDPSASDRSHIEIKNRRPKRRASTQPPPTSPSAANPDSEYLKNPVEPVREDLVNPVGVAHNPEMLTWGRGGARSHTRHGGGSAGRGTRGSRMSKLMDQLESSSKIDYMTETPFALVSLDKEKIPNLEKPWLCLQSSSSVNQLRKLVADEAKFQAEDVKMLLVKEAGVDKTSADYSHMIDRQDPLSRMVNWSNICLEILEGQETLAGLRCSTNTIYLILAYQCKKDNRQIQPSPL